MNGLKKYKKKYYSTIKKNEIIPFSAAQLNLEIIILCEESQAEKYKDHMIPHMWNLKKKKMIQINLFTKQK